MYDLIIVGLGPGAFSAALYAARYKMKILVVGKLMAGLAGMAHSIENYPGVDKLSGLELIKKMHDQVKQYGVHIKQEEVIGIKKGNQFVVKTRDEEYRGKSVILALGTQRRKLGLSEEDKFVSKGLSYCALCDGPLGKDKVVATVFPDSNKKYLSTDLLKEEPVKNGFLSPDVELDHFRAFKRVCHTCCDPAVCVEKDFQGDFLKLPHCPRRMNF